MIQQYNTIYYQHDRDVSYLRCSTTRYNIVYDDRDGGSIDWIVVRNRLSNLDAFNKRDIERLVTELTTRINFRTIPGLSERVIFRELFLLGLTILDLKDASKDKRLSPSHLAARSEILEIMNSIKINKIRKTKK